MSKVRFPVEAGQIMMLARAIGETNPVYFDEALARETEAGGIIAPPTFAATAAHYDPDYPLRPKLGVKWFGSGRTPSGIEGKPAAGGGLHAEEEYTYFRPLRPGDTLTCEKRPGATWEKPSKRGGKLTFRERFTEYRDQADELVLIVRSVYVATERPLDSNA